MTDAPMNPDAKQSIDTGHQHGDVTRVYQISGFMLRIRAHLDGSNIEDSYAVAEILNGAHWAELVNDPADNWWNEVQSEAYAPDVETGLEVVADRLHASAVAALATA